MISKKIHQTISYYALGHTFIIVIISLGLFYFLLSKEPLLTFIIIFLTGLISYSIFLIKLLSNLKNKTDNFFEISKFYAYNVVSLSIIYGIIAFFLFPQDYIIIYGLPMIGIIMSAIIPHFYKKMRI